VVGDYARFFSGLAAGLPWTLAGAHGAFEFRGRRYPYLYHRYKHTWLTERAVEVPVVQAIVDRHRGRRVLEVGNVLSHYGDASHLVVDKYEQAPGILNRDVLDLDDLGPFDLVVAVSTLEHVGRDEEPRDPELAPEAVRRLEALLAPGGRLVVTIPVGYHPGLDEAFRTGAFSTATLRALRRSSLGPNWRERHPDDVWGTPYDFLLYSARAVLFAEFERPAA
jgi:SAM-dependent methyltransferase